VSKFYSSPSVLKALTDSRRCRRMMKSEARRYEAHSR